MRPFERDPTRSREALDAREVLELASPRVVRMVRRMCTCEADVEDVLQDVYLAAVRTSSRFDRTRCFQAWVSGIARHRLLDRRRSSGRCVPFEVEPIDMAVGPHAELEGAELWQVLLRAVRKLPPIYRSVIELHYVEGLPLRDVAPRLGRGPNTVRTQVQRALRLLREALPGSLVG
jgi:RNA polymerase sigma-70 factor (ECF subfamily)